MIRARQDAENGIVGPAFQHAAAAFLFHEAGDWQRRTMASVVARIRELMPANLRHGWPRLDRGGD
eukprot:2958519-Lingulodinium_polyedra.AAC.1